MAIQFLNISAEDAVTALTKIIEEGYEIKIGMDQEYAATKKAKDEIDNSSVVKCVDKWEAKANEWFRAAMEKLLKIYTSKRMSFEFREAKPGLGLQRTTDNPKWHSVSRNMGVKLDKLNRFDDFIKREFRVEIEYIAGDKFEHYGSGNQNKKSAE